MSSRTFAELSDHASNNGRLPRAEVSLTADCVDNTDLIVIQKTW